MSAPLFTPGPWSITDRGDLFRIRNDNDEVIATTDNGGHPVEEIFDYATQEANARLIAAAPELYEALNEAAQDARAREAEYVQRALPGSEKVWREKAEHYEALLAKARGEQ